MDDSSASSSVSFVSQETQLIEAVLNEDYVVLKEWIKNNLLDVTSDKKLYLSLKAKNVASKLIRVAAHKGKTAIVDLLRKHAYLDVKDESANNWTVLHYAVMGITCDSPLKNVQDDCVTYLNYAEDSQLHIIYMLYESGVSVTIKSCGITPFTLALDPSINFHVGAVLLEKLQLMQGKGIPPQVKEIPKPTYNDCIDCLVQWAIYRKYADLVKCLLKDYKGIPRLSNRFLKLDSENKRTMFHVAAETGNSDIMKTLIDVSQISPEVIANWRYQHEMPRNCDEDPLIHVVETPFSSAIAQNHINIIHEIAVADAFLHQFTYLDLSNVHIKKVPKEIFTLACLKILDLSQNSLKSLPDLTDDILNIKVSDLDLSRNRLTNLPSAVLEFPLLGLLKASHNSIRSVPNNWWQAAKLQQLDLNHNEIKTFGIEPIYYNDQLSHGGTSSPGQSVVSHVDVILKQKPSLQGDTYSKMESISVLATLRLNENLLESFPRGLACLAPKLESLHLAHNKIKNVCPIEEIPSRIRFLDISFNSLTSNIFYLGKCKLCCLRSPSQPAPPCYHMDHRCLSNLGSLNCSNNKLEQILLFDEEENLLFPKLFALNLSCNKFTELPMQLYQFSELKILNIGSNPDVKQIPLDTGYITGLIEFDYDGIGDPVIDTLNTIPHIAEKLGYLRAMRQSSEKNSIIRLMIVGPSKNGKSTLLKYLKSRNRMVSQSASFHDRLLAYSFDSHAILSKSYEVISKQDLQSTVGIDLGEFVYDGGRSTSEKITFVTWDFAGQEEYFITHHCFISPGAIYVICCKVQDLFESGVNTLLPWLVMIKAKAPGSPVLVVGTFCDQLSFTMWMKCDAVKKEIIQHFSCPNSSLMVEIHDIIFVECVNNRIPRCIDLLRKKLYELAFTVTVPPAHKKRGHYQCHQKLLHQLIPKSYIDLQGKLLAMGGHIRRHLVSQQPILTWAELQKAASEYIDNEVELYSAVEHMKRNGTVIHFDADGLQDLYFIDPQWLIDKLALVVTTPNRDILAEFSGQQHPEIVHIQSMMKHLFNYGFLPDFQKDFCKLLSRFEIAIPIDESRLFFPSLLPTHSQFHYFHFVYSFPGKNIDSIKAEMMEDYLNLDGRQTNGHVGSVANNVALKPTGLCYRRCFALTAMPIPLWPRLITRCLTTSKFLEIIKRNCVKSLPFHEFQDLGKAGVGHSVLEWVYWKNGIELRLCRMTLLQISNVNLTSAECSENVATHESIRNIQLNTGNQWIKLPTCFTGGLEVIVPECILLSIGNENDEHMISSSFSAQIFTHCVEVIDEIFMEWFTTSKTGNSTQAMSKYLICFTPCPICLGDQDNRPVTDPPPEPGAEPSVPQGGYSINQDLSTSQDFSIPSKVGSLASWFTITKRSKNSDQCVTRRFSFRHIDDSDVCSSGDPVGFTTKHCLWIAQVQTFVNCPMHGALDLKRLTPDLVYADVPDNFVIQKDNIVLKSGGIIGKGGFGNILKKQLRMVEYKQSLIKDVAVKVLSKCDDPNPDNELQRYSDNRRELNMIYDLNHIRIVKFYGVLINPVAFVMEWAGHGSLDAIIKQYRSHKSYICPDSVLAVAYQVVSGLSYLHGKNIVHFDLKPQNILIFDFPRESHCCYTQDCEEVISQRCIHCYKPGNIDGVRIKLADFGISVRKGPNGFVRTCATAGHTAPEALIGLGQEQLSESVDIFALGMCIYETMALTLVPPLEYTVFEFDGEVKGGIRPRFPIKSPRYPALLYDCVTSCWDQDPQLRPSPKRLLDLLSPTKLHLLDFYIISSYKITDVQCSCKVFTEGSTESIWIAVKNESGGSNLLILNFQVDGSRVNPQPYLLPEEESSVKFKKVLKICQVNMFVYIIQEGMTIDIIRSQSYTHMQTIENPFTDAPPGDLQPCDVSYIQSLNILLVLFKNGYIGTLSLPGNSFDFTEVMSEFQYQVMSSIGQKGAQLFSLGIDCHFVSMEIVASNDSDGDKCEVWCGCDNNRGCDNNSIIIVSLNPLVTEGSLVCRTISNISDKSCRVEQLKSVNTFHLQLVCALLNIGSIVCYDADTKDCLCRIPASTAIVMFPYNSKLYLGTSSGEVLRVNINSYLTNKITEKPVVCGRHKTVGQDRLNLLTVTGELSSHNFVEGFGTMSYKTNNKLCRIMLSIGGGFTELIPRPESPARFSATDLCIISFIL